MSSWRRTSLVTALALCSPLAFLGQVEIQPRQKSKPAEKQDDTPRPNIRIDTNLVLIPVAVNDELARPIAGLEKKHFKIFDNKVEQTITSFSMENEPIAMGLVFDTSGSMTWKPAGRIALGRHRSSSEPPRRKTSSLPGGVRHHSALDGSADARCGLDSARASVFESRWLDRDARCDLPRAAPG